MDGGNRDSDNYLGNYNGQSSQSDRGPEVRYLIPFIDSLSDRSSKLPY